MPHQSVWLMVCPQIPQASGSRNILMSWPLPGARTPSALVRIGPGPRGHRVSRVRLAPPTGLGIQPTGRAGTHVCSGNVSYPPSSRVVSAVAARPRVVVPVDAVGSVLPTRAGALSSDVLSDHFFSPIRRVRGSGVIRHHQRPPSGIPSCNPGSPGPCRQGVGIAACRRRPSGTP